MTMSFNPSRLAQIFGPTPTNASIAAGPAPAITSMAASPPLPPPPIPISPTAAPSAPMPSTPTLAPTVAPHQSVPFIPSPAATPPLPVSPTVAPNPFPNVSVSSGPSPALGNIQPPTNPFAPSFGLPVSQINSLLNSPSRPTLPPPPPTNPTAWGTSRFSPMNAPTMGQPPPWARPQGLVQRPGYQPGMAPPSPFTPNSPYSWNRPALSPTAQGGSVAMPGVTIAGGPSPALGNIQQPNLLPPPGQRLPGVTISGGPVAALGTLSDRRAKTNITRVGSIFGGRK